MSAKAHHFVPQFILRNFTDNCGHLHFWRRDKGVENIGMSSPRNLFQETHLYSSYSQDGRRDNRLEQFFANRIEPDTATLFRRLLDEVRSGSVPELSAKDWATWRSFWYFQMKRSPGYMRSMADVTNVERYVDGQLAKAQANNVIDATVAQTLKPRMLQNINVAAQAAGPSEKVQRRLAGLGMAIYYSSNAHKSFVVGDIPGASVSLKSADGTTMFARFLPISDDVALGLSDGPPSVTIVNVPPTVVRRMNEATLARSEVIAGRSNALVASLARAATTQVSAALSSSGSGTK
ncbi:DUF4238 domain-containing protein [Rhizobium leguminosarum]|uniref:DUF4238 domain-containing protein n=1 Tax=Rhizobium leguminosarum TaxID=384 RepID=A0AAJ1A5V3_RHILE|nr:DUF4238 domain-containing protein [Rhizobium leguminosarum]MBY5533008.1 DUF4238 domain-containing protein [Rhizobium leguminosarum]MBY5594051.1 DUF4238 domain-containing protein [Rhizobium leguminosarum]MBY5614246.1 DUF4238 domain-containing protein [Rhizobium leguminosarum]MBY5627792.1 DUF4238 domain-containing protein [Rhizobium leguminosarum]MBY5728909.1 DUF4238 domain-containing protein [Rhizobium leguminosarum]